LDELPYGDFVELEGPEAAIKTAAADLGLSWDKRITNNYLGLMSAIKAFYKLDFDDLTFANFQNIRVQMADLVPTI